MNETYTGILDLSFTYSMETSYESDIYNVLADIEGEILIKLSETVLSCGETDAFPAATGVPFDKAGLGIVGVNSFVNPHAPSELSKCYGMKDGRLLVVVVSTMEERRCLND